MVVISIIGVRMTRPKSIVVCAATEALPPAITETSNEVPPRSQVIDIVEAGWPCAMRRARDHAGGRARQRRAHRQLPRGRGRHDPAVRLHDVELAREALLRERRSSLPMIGGDHRLQIGVDRRGRGAFELADFGQHLVRGGDELVRPDRRARRERAALVRRDWHRH